jgi:outer membrane lipoprotein
MRHLFTVFLSLALVVGCATGPRYETEGVAVDLVPSEVAASPGVHRDARVIWGGMIVATRNLADYTEMEVLGYPLGSAQRPETGRNPQGRFLVRKPGYLEEVDYSQGRRITVTGRLGENVDGQVGEAPYVYPVVQATDIHLWPRETYADPGGRTRFNIGVGVIFSR